MPFADLGVLTLDRAVFHFFFTQRGAKFRHLLLKITDREGQPLNLLNGVFDLPHGPFQIDPDLAQLGQQRRVARGFAGRPRARRRPRGRFGRARGFRASGAAGSTGFHDEIISFALSGSRGRRRWRPAEMGRRVRGAPPRRHTAVSGSSRRDPTIPGWNDPGDPSAIQSAATAPQTPVHRPSALALTAFGDASFAHGAVSKRRWSAKLK